ncbi:MAG: FAD-linked oxidase C-terminal domain-containing protein, partial [Thermodesulfobacteriota bacterium]
ITDVSRIFQALGELPNNYGVRLYASSRAGNGIVIVSMEGEISPLIEATRSLHNLVSSLKGNLMIQDAPSYVKSQVDVWGEIGAPLKVMARLKSLFDPNNILNPGRFVGGI